MKLGIISDTHDNIPQIKKAVEIFNQHKVDFVVHCGDFIAPFSLKPLNVLNCRWIGVFGNNDGERRGLQNNSQGRIKEPPYILELDSKKIVIVHTVNNHNIDSADIVAFGHTHKSEFFKQGETIFINPGECGGWLYGKSTIAVLELTTLKPQIINL